MSDRDADNAPDRYRQPDHHPAPPTSDGLPRGLVGWVDGTAAAAVRAPRLGLLALLPLRCQDRLLRLALRRLAASGGARRKG
jgi:hypothetical protein